MVAPRQLCQHCWHNFAAPISLVKLTHSEEITTGKTTQTWLTAGDVGHQLINDTVTGAVNPYLLAFGRLGRSYLTGTCGRIFR